MKTISINSHREADVDVNQLLITFNNQSIKVSFVQHNIINFFLLAKQVQVKGIKGGAGTKSPYGNKFYFCTEKTTDEAYFVTDKDRKS